MRSWETDSVESTQALGVTLARELIPNGILLLTGDLGVGKSVLARGVGEGLGIDPAEIQSPTFTLVHSHQGDSHSLTHVDLYRLEPADIPHIGLEETLLGPGVKVVEWAERLPFDLPGALSLTLSRAGSTDRRVITETTQTRSD